MDEVYNNPLCYFFGFLIIATLIIYIKFLYKIDTIRKSMPYYPFRLWNPLGNVPLMVVTGAWKNSISKGLGFNVLFLQMAQAFCRVFANEKFMCLWLSYFPLVVITKAEAVEDCISGTKIMRKGSQYSFLHVWLGTGLLTSHGSKWKNRRKLLTPAFHFEILQDFVPVFAEQSQVLVNNLQKDIDKDWIDISAPITLCSLDIICETTLGTKIGAQLNKDSKYVRAVSRATSILMERAINFPLWFDFLFNLSKQGKDFKNDIKVLHDFTLSVIQEKKKRLLSGDLENNTGRRRKALMDLLLEHHIKTNELTEDDIREEVDTFAFEGHDTTATGMSWALYLIGLYKDIQQNICQELDGIFCGDTERPITMDDLKDMTYLERVLKESQRLYPSVPMISRYCDKDVTICGYRIPKGADCAIVTYELHRDENIFPDPEKFDPDRFLPENTVNRHPFAYIPFSAGPRNCIGQRFALMEEKAVVSNILRNYSLESLDHRDKLPASSELILRSPYPIRIKIRPRI